VAGTTKISEPIAHHSSRVPVTLLDVGNLPLGELADLAAREGKRPRAVYGAHKWFARRAGSAFRALLVASALPADADFWQGFYGEADLTGQRVLDPFVGGGTSVVEAGRLGAEVFGVDVDPVACAVTSFETRAHLVANPLVALETLKSRVGPRLREYYLTRDASGEDREVLHFFWVQVVNCRACDAAVEAHPHFQLGYQSEGKLQWAFCEHCHHPQELPKIRRHFACARCKHVTSIQQAPVVKGTLHCPNCSARERLIDVADRTKLPPQWRMFALETIPVNRPGAGRVPMTGRTFQAATEADAERYAAAAAESRSAAAGMLDRLDDVIPVAGRSDDRLVRYGYSRYRELFNDRQLLHLACLSEALAELPADQREAAALAFSDHLATNCMMTCYAGGWRRLVPLFAIRAFRHIPRPVEINPWLDGVGRGTYPNALRQVARAVASAKEPTELLRDGGDLPVPARTGNGATIVHGTAKNLPFALGSVDLVLTDPPYFDNINYSELADFYRPWLENLGLNGATGPTESRTETLAASRRGGDAATDFADALGVAMAEVARVLTDEGRLVFTFRHNDVRGWKALADALWYAEGFTCLQVFPILAEGVNKLHTHANTGTWDAVFVLAKGRAAARFSDLSAEAAGAAAAHARDWSSRLAGACSSVPFKEQDATNFEQACLVAASLGAFRNSARSSDRPQG
jgi:putative DNA methylase